MKIFRFIFAVPFYIFSIAAGLVATYRFFWAAIGIYTTARNPGALDSSWFLVLGPLLYGLTATAIAYALWVVARKISSIAPTANLTARSTETSAKDPQTPVL